MASRASKTGSLYVVGTLQRKTLERPGIERRGHCLGRDAVIPEQLSRPDVLFL